MVQCRRPAAICHSTEVISSRTVDDEWFIRSSLAHRPGPRRKKAAVTYPMGPIHLRGPQESSIDVSSRSSRASRAALESISTCVHLLYEYVILMISEASNDASSEGRFYTFDPQYGRWYCTAAAAAVSQQLIRSPYPAPYPPRSSQHSECQPLSSLLSAICQSAQIANRSLLPARFPSNPRQVTSSGRESRNLGRTRCIVISGLNVRIMKTLV